LTVVELLFSGSEKEAMFIPSEIGQMRRRQKQGQEGGRKEKRPWDILVYLFYGVQHDSPVRLS